jgi:hypothetical protein
MKTSSAPKCRPPPAISICRRGVVPNAWHLLALLVILSLLFLLAAPRRAAHGATSANHGVTFSDELGGFTLERVSGNGTMDDPFVIVERITSPNGGTLVFHVDPTIGNLIGSQHAIGFAMIKVILNATDFAWNAFDLELQSELGKPSDYTDGLSFGQGSAAGRPFTADRFTRVTVIDEPYDQVQFEGGKVPVGGRVTLRFVVSESLPLATAYLLQRPSRPVAERFSRVVRRPISS